MTVQLAWAQTYFPSGALGKTPQSSEAVAGRYSQFLKAMREPSLYELAQQNSGDEAYRFLWLREFDRPVIIRFVVKPNGTGWFYRRVESGTGISAPGRTIDRGMSWSWKSRTASFLNTIETTGFWNLPSFSEDNANSLASCRAHWVLEGVRNGQYHVVDRCSPDEADPVRVVAVRAMKLGSLRPRNRHVY